MLPRVAVDEWGFVSESRSEDVGPKPRSGSEKSTAGCSTATGRAVQVSSLEQRAPKVRIRGEAGCASFHTRHCLAHRVEVERGFCRTYRRWSLAISQPRDLLVVHRNASTTSNRATFGRACAELDVDELEREESEILEKLWYVAYSFVCEPRRRRKGATRYLAEEMSNRRKRFLLSAADGVSSVLGSSGDVTIHSENCHIDGKACLVIACNHGSISSITTLETKRSLMRWRAPPENRIGSGTKIRRCCANGTNVVVVHKLRGRMVEAAGVTMSTLVLFMHPEDEEFGDEYVIDLPLPESDLAAVGFRVWSSPAVRAAVLWRLAMALLAQTVARITNVAEFIGANTIPERWLAEVDSMYEAELVAAEVLLQRGWNELAAMLGTMTDCDQAQLWLDQLGDLMGPSELETKSGECRPIPQCAFDYVTNPSPFLELFDEIVDWAARESGVAEASLAVN